MICMILLGVAVTALSLTADPAQGGLCTPPTVQKESPYH